MASLNPSSAHIPRNDGALLLDALWEVLLRLSAKELCHLRAVCRLWHSITSRPDFIAAHAARHPGPLLVGGLYPTKNRPDEGPFRTDTLLVMDLSGNVVKRISTPPHTGKVLPTSLDLVCTTMITDQASVLNPATGEVYVLPRNLEFCGDAIFTLGKVPMGEYKVLCLIQLPEEDENAVEVLTLNSSNPMQWRAKKPLHISVSSCLLHRVVIKGVVYFLLTPYGCPDISLNCLARFDLTTEEWMSGWPYQQGPLTIPAQWEDNMICSSVSLVELDGSLVFARHTVYPSDCIMELWYALDLEISGWEMKYRISLGLCTFHLDGHPSSAYPMMILPDGGVVICSTALDYDDDGPHECLLMEIYDPKTGILGTDHVLVRDALSVAIYTGSLLSIRNDADMN